MTECDVHCFHSYEAPSGEWLEECCLCEEVREEDDMLGEEMP